MPSEAKLRQAVADLRNTDGDKNRRPEASGTQIIDQLLKRAETTDDLALRYALFCEAGTIAEDLSSAELVNRIANKVCIDFLCDAGRLKCQAAERMAARNPCKIAPCGLARLYLIAVVDSMCEPRPDESAARRALRLAAGPIERCRGTAALHKDLLAAREAADRLVQHPELAAAEGPPLRRSLEEAIASITEHAKKPEAAAAAANRLAPPVIPQVSRLRLRVGTRPKITPDVLQSIDQGLDWLLRHQNANGSWGHDPGKLCPADDRCDGASAAHLTVGITALALLPLLAEGNAPGKGPHGEAVARGITWLLGQQSSDGAFVGPMKEQITCHALATLVLCESIALSRDAGLLEKAQSAVGFLTRSRTPKAGWRYMPGRESDMAVTSWCVQALISAGDIGIATDKAALAEVLAWIDSRTDEGGATGYMDRGTPPSRLSEEVDRFPAHLSLSPTASALLCRRLLGQTVETPILANGVDLLLALKPTWRAEGYIDMYYWFFGSASLALVGGERSEEWRHALTLALVPNQCRAGHEAGSWDPVDPWSHEGGRIYSTVMCLLALQSPYRLASPR